MSKKKNTLEEADSFSLLPESVQKEVMAQAEARVRSDVRNQELDRIRSEVRSEIKANDIDEVMKILNDLEEMRFECAKIMGRQIKKRKLIEDPENSDRKIYALDTSKWTEEGRKAEKDYEELTDKVEQYLNETYLKVELTNNPYGDEPKLVGAVNGKEWVMYHGNINSDGKTVKCLIPLAAYVALQKDLTGRHQAGVQSWRLVRVVDGMPKNEGFVKPVMLKAEKATETEVENYFNERNSRMIHMQDSQGRRGYITN